MTTSQELALREATTSAVAQLRDPSFLDEIRTALPEGQSPHRFVRALATVLMDKPELAKPELRRSLLKGVLKAAQDGLVPDGREGALIVFGNEIAWLPMIGGIRKILAEHGWSLRTSVIYSADTFEYDEGEATLLHRPPRPGVDRGTPEGAYALAVHKDGRRELVVYSREQIQEVQQKSARSKKVWQEWPDRMWEKTPAHRLAKKLPLDPADKERLERVLAASASDPVGLLYGDAEQPHSVAEALDPVVPQLPPESGDQAAGEVPSSPAAGPPEGVDAETGEIVGEAFEGEEPPPLTDEPPPAQEEGEEPRFETGRYAGQTIGQVWEAGADGQAYVRWAYKSWKSEPMRSALDRFGEEQKQAQA